jgi:hypothetical protein
MREGALIKKITACQGFIYCVLCFLYSKHRVIKHTTELWDQSYFCCKWVRMNENPILSLKKGQVIVGPASGPTIEVLVPPTLVCVWSLVPKSRCRYEHPHTLGTLSWPIYVNQRLFPLKSIVPLAKNLRTILICYLVKPLSILARGGHSHVWGIRVCAALTTPFFRLLSSSQDPLFQLASVLKPHILNNPLKFWQFYTKFMPILAKFRSQAPNLRSF